MEKKKAKSKSKLPTLPDHLIMEEILPRLPVKSLLRFKSVSKYWHTTICSNEFQQQQLKFSSLCPQIIILDFWHIIYPSYLLSFDECNNVKECVELEDKYPVLNPPSSDKLENPPRYSFVIGSYNGLVCLFDPDSCFIVWNPATNQYQNVDFPDCDYEHVVECPGMGFGYVSSIDDYRIMLLINFCYEVDNCWLQVYIYSLRARTWIPMGILDDELLLLWSYPDSVVVDDFIYCPPPVSEYGVNIQSYISGLNLVTGLMKKIPLMYMLSDYENVHLSQIKGCLSLGCVKNKRVGSSSCVYDVWLLKKPDDCNSWEKTFSLNIGPPSNDLIDSHLFEMGKCLISRNMRVKLIDLCEGAQEQYEQDNNTSHHPGSTTKGWKLPIEISESWGYVESLISPFMSYEHEDDPDLQ